MKPFFSIIIPTLNEERYLPNLLDCLVRQTCKVFEVHIVDGKSTDKTIEKAKEYKTAFKKNGISITVHTGNKRNVAYQRNVGARHATGTYLVFFDADVAIEKAFLSKVTDHIDKDESLFLTTWTLPDSDELVDEILVLISNIGVELSRYGPKPLIPGCNIIIERNCFAAVGGFDEKLKMAEDHHFAQKARKKGLSLRMVHTTVQLVSMRRFQSEGRISVLRKYTKALRHIMLKGPIREDIFDYQMGGEYHENTRHEPIAKKIRKGLLKRIYKKIKENA